MNIISVIDDFFEMISDPRNVAPDIFAKFYPLSGEPGNKKKLSENEIEKLFESRNRFKAPPNWAGYKPIYSKYISILHICENLKQADLEVATTYYTHRCLTDHCSFNSDFWKNEGLLSKKEYYEIWGMYEVFFKSILSDLSFDIDRNSKVKHDAHSNNYPDWFKSDKAFSLFKEFEKKHIVDIRLDHSFLYQQLLKKGLIHKPKNQEQYFEWLYNESYINEKEFEMLIEKRFYAYGKCAFGHRLQNFNYLFDLQ